MAALRLEALEAAHRGNTCTTAPGAHRPLGTAHSGAHGANTSTRYIAGIPSSPEALAIPGCGLSAPLHDGDASYTWSLRQRPSVPWWEPLVYSGWWANTIFHRALDAAATGSQNERQTD